jgi:type VII secretion integral membrane protein EccD
MTASLTRVTVTASQRSAELLLPSDEPIASLLPRIAEIVGETQESDARWALNQVGGPSLTSTQSLDEHDVLDGTQLLLTRAQDALPDPVVYDVSDAVEQELPSLQPAGTQDLLHALFAALALLTAFGLWTRLDPSTALPAAAAVGTAALLAAAVVPTRARPWLSRMARVVPLITVPWALILTPLPEGRGWWLLCLTVLLCQAAGAISRRDVRALLHVVLTAALTAGAWAAALTLSRSLPIAGSVAGSVSLVLLGLVPRWAIGVAGLNRLDDDRARDATVRRTSVAAALRTAHRSLEGSLLWLAGSVAVGSYVLSGAPARPEWDIPLMAVWSLTLALRTRHVPLAGQKAILGVSAGIVAVHVLVALDHVLAHPVPLVVGAAAGVVVAVLMAAAARVSVPEHVRAQARMLGDRTEFLAALSILPLLIGQFGVYASLATTFQR